MPQSMITNIVARVGLFVLLFWPFPGAAVADTMLDREQFTGDIGERQSSFLALDLTSGARCVLAGSDLETRHAPWSTFKIPNTLIALETGVAESIESWRDWDPKLRPAAHYWPDAWRQGQTLQSAFQRSAVWYFQDIAVEVGAPRYRDLLSDWGYGNADVPTGSDTFWLGGPLALSVTEQVHFLERLLTGALRVDDVHLEALTRVAAAGNLGALKLYGKTGAGPVQAGQFSGSFEGWYAGWLGQNGKVAVVFAHHAQGAHFSSIRSFRQDFAEVLLKACGYR
ncbi:penicillin-binding transpeptidase domain-containing protein [uncultured Roseobacter sp.]|uniref:penicillin-binding transpeptidase domain-containing protein n=1 Tax=uncultured Roseobacter sp. TaxID=114847 RepID=UPI0026077167|nr:penicillin-binding transpeptidase domain-containing protein [uncultured Roseobacter sp.]